MLHGTLSLNLCGAELLVPSTAAFFNIDSAALQEAVMDKYTSG
jgi:hypothetical protein